MSNGERDTMAMITPPPRHGKTEAAKAMSEFGVQDDRTPPGMAELNPAAVRAQIMQALNLPPEAQTKRIGEIKRSLEGSSMSLQMARDVQDCPVPAGFTPEAAQAMGEPQPAFLDAQGRPVPPVDSEEPGSSPENPQRLRMRVKMFPMVVMSACACGLKPRTPDPSCVAAARKNGVEMTLPRCRCGRFSIGYTPPKRKNEKRS